MALKLGEQISSSIQLLINEKIKINAKVIKPPYVLTIKNKAQHRPVLMRACEGNQYKKFVRKGSKESINEIIEIEGTRNN